MIKNYYSVVVTNELPRIGSGYRMVGVETGKKWVYVSDIVGEGRTRMTQKAWSQIKVICEHDPSDVLKGVRKADRKLGRRPRRKL